MTSKIIPILDEDYKKWLTSIKADYRRSQIKAAAKVNAELIAFNWRLGRSIALMRGEVKWGSGFFEALSRDLKELLPDSKGFSPRNLRYVRRFYEMFPDQIHPQVGGKSFQTLTLLKEGKEILPQVGAEIFMVPWNHIKCIIDKCYKDPKKALFYIRETIKNNWSRAILLNFLGTDLYERKGKAIANFPSAIPEYEGDLAAEITKDPYNFDFLTIRKGYDEKALKDALIANIERFLLELGTGFAYMGREYRLNLGDEEEFCDMLFYNTSVHAYVVVEVKVDKLKPADVGQLGTYVVAVDHTLRSDADNKTIGLLICREKSEIIARYALESSNEPLGISSYELSSLLPKDLESGLPSVEEIESKAGEGLDSLHESDVLAVAMKKRREEIGMTQQELAQLCKMPQSSIARIESGASLPNLGTARKICDALGLAIKICFPKRIALQSSEIM